MAVASPSRDKTEMAVPPPASPPQRLASAPPASALRRPDSSDAAAGSGGSSPSDPGELSDRRDSDASRLASRSEEYRLLFRLPPDEVLVQDFNCALQENILLQGHMYLFLHHVCFYSNIFGFETKKTIPLQEITVVRKAKMVAIFPNAIEIIAGGKRHFFGSFLSRDEAYRIIVDSWAQHNGDANALLECQDTKSVSSSEDNGYVLLDGAKESKPEDDLSSSVRIVDARLSDCKTPVNGTAKISGASDTRSTAEVSVSKRYSEVQEHGAEDTSNPLNPFNFEPEDVDAPNVPECYTLITEAKFQVCVEDFFSLLVSDGSANIWDDFHKKCGDKDFRCTPWCRDEQLGLIRNVSFLHPIKIYLGAKFGSCQEVQKLRVYRNSHLIIQKSQTISDAPYGDHFAVEGIWDVAQDSVEENSCTLRVFLYVAFSKKTIFKGKIEQSTKDECREVYGLWIKLAQDFLKQKTVAESKGVIDKSIHENRSDVPPGVPLNESPSENEHPIVNSPQDIPNTSSLAHHIEDTLRENLGKFSSVSSSLRELWATFMSYTRTNKFPLILIVAFVAILILMQLTIILLLTRSPKVYMVSHESSVSGFGGYGKESIEWLRKRLILLSEEMRMAEAHMERMHHEFAWLKTHLERLERLRGDS